MIPAAAILETVRELVAKEPFKSVGECPSHANMGYVLGVHLMALRMARIEGRPSAELFELEKQIGELCK